MNVLDLHCDTPYELFKKGEPLTENSGHVSLARAARLGRYAQVMAIWTEHRLDDEAAWEQFFRIREDFLSKIPADRAVLCRTASEAHAAFAAGKIPFFLMVEGARLLAGKLDRLDALAEAGVRILTLTWKDADCIGGSYNTHAPLTAFGREVVEGCMARGMIVDVSHASVEVTDEVLATAVARGKPVVATHSNSFAICPHPRNLTDARALRIAATGGLVGVSMAPQHLAPAGEADAGQACRHILHGLEIGLGGALALGCDFDGIEQTPRDIRTLSDLPRLNEALAACGVDEATREATFFGNAMRFFERNFA